MQSAFFKLANIIPEDEATQYLKDSISKAYGKKGEKVVNMNNAAIDKGVESIVVCDTEEQAKEYISTHAHRKDAGIYKRTFIKVL